MANKINIVISADDKASRPIRDISKELDGASSSSSGFKSAFGSMAGVVAKGSLALGAAGVAATGAGVAIGFNFNSAVEQAQTKLQAFMGDNERVARTLDWVKQEASATQFSFAEMADAAADLTPVAKSSGAALEDLVKQAEVLAALNPTEGLTGATFSLREALSGDWVSIVDRFNLPRNRINQLKAEGVPAMEIISRTLQEMGVNYDLVSSQGKTVSARWDQLTDKLKMMAGQATKPLFDRVSKELDTLSGFDYEGTGANLERIVQGAIVGFDNAVSFAKTVVETVRSVPEAIQKAFETATDWVGARFEDAAKLGGAGLDFFRERAEDARKKLEEFKGWLEENETAIKSVATVLGVVFGPALIRAGVLAAIQGAKIAAAGIAAGAGWTKGAVAAGLAWVVNGAKTVAVSLVTSVKMVAHAVAVGVAHSAQAVAAAAAWSVQFARMLVVSSVTAIKMAIHASDVGWAWVINGTRSAFAWVTTSLPRIVAAMALTSAAAVSHAFASSTAWVASAARSAFAWVVTELPRIIIGFVLTSASASSNALIASAAWVAAAARSGIAWVVTELPRIIGAFVSMAGAAVVQAAIASGAWIASAVASSGAITALSALAATPMVLPALVIVAALASIAAVKSAHDEMTRAVQGQEAEIKRSLDATETAVKRNIDVQASGVYSLATKERFQTATNNITAMDKRAIGTNFAPGGSTVLGEHGPEIVNLPAGSQVSSAWKTASQTSSDGAGAPSITINGNVILQNATAVDSFFKQADQAQRFARMGMA